MNKESTLKKSNYETRNDLSVLSNELSQTSPAKTTIESNTLKKLSEPTTIKKSIVRNFNILQSTLHELKTSESSPLSSNTHQKPAIADRKNSFGHTSSALSFSPDLNCFSIQQKRCAELASFDQKYSFNFNTYNYG